jgi:hypothetical protein
MLFWIMAGIGHRSRHPHILHDRLPLTRSIPSALRAKQIEKQINHVWGRLHEAIEHFIIA